MGHTFISYARADQEYVRRLADKLQLAGIRVWLDEHIAPGDHFDDVIDAALDAAEKVIVVWSASSVSSQWVRAEASEGLKRRILIPVRIDQAKVPLEFRRLQTIDFSSWNGEIEAREFQALLAGIRGSAPRDVRERDDHPISGDPARRKTRGRTRFYHVVAAIVAVLLIGAAWAYLSTSSGAAQPELALAPVDRIGKDIPEALPASLRDELLTAFEAENTLTTVSEEKGQGDSGAFVLSATIRQVGDQLRFTFRLREPAAGKTLLSHQIDRPFADSLVAAHQVAYEASHIVLCGLTGEDKAADLGAAALTVRLQICQEIFNTDASWERRLHLARRLTELAPHSADAWAQRAFSAAMHASTEATRREALDAAKRSHELNPRNSLVYIAYSELIPEADVAGREKLLRKAVATCVSRCGGSYASLAWLLLSVGRINEAVNAFSQAHASNPNGPYAVHDLAEALYAAGRFNEARKYIVPTSERWPGRNQLHWLRFRLALATNRLDEARQLLASRQSEGDLTSNERQAWVSTIDALATGQPHKINAAAGQVLKLSESKEADRLLAVAALAHLGRKPDALRAVIATAHHRFEMWPVFWSTFDGSRALPELYQRLEALRLPGYWRASKTWPDFCAKTRSDPDVCRRLAAT